MLPANMTDKQLHDALRRLERKMEASYALTDAQQRRYSALNSEAYHRFLLKQST